MKMRALSDPLQILPKEKLPKSLSFVAARSVNWLFWCGGYILRAASRWRQWQIQAPENAGTRKARTQYASDPEDSVSEDI